MDPGRDNPEATSKRREELRGKSSADHTPLQLHIVSTTGLGTIVAAEGSGK